MKITNDFNSVFITYLLGLLILISFLVPLNSYAAEKESEDFTLTILHMNDTHAHVEQLPSLISTIQEVRNERPDSLLLHGGDVFSGTLYFNQFKGQADLALMNLMNIDAMVFGNHEFDLGSSENGQQSLAKFVEGANFPFLGTNIDFSRDAFMSSKAQKTFTAAPEAGQAYDGIIQEIDGEQVGIFGLTTEETADIASPVNVTFSDYIEEAQRAVDSFKELGVNKIIAVTHLGFDSNPQVGNDILLAQQVDEIDVIVGGHSHTRLSEPVMIERDLQGNEKDPTLIVQAYQYGNFLGDLQVSFDGDGIIKEYSGQLLDTNEREPNQEAQTILQPFKEEIEALANQETGAIAQKRLNNPRLSDSEVSVRANETELGNLITDAMLAKAKEQVPEVQIAMQNGGGIRAAIEEGPIRVGDIIAVLPFGNDPTVVELSGAEIREALEHSVRLAPEESGAFLHVAGMTFTYDSTKEPGSRIVSALVDNDGVYEEIQDTQTYLITTNNFTAKGGDGFDVFARAYEEGRVRDLGQIDWQQLLDYLVAPTYLNGVVNPVLEGRIVDTMGVIDEEKPEPTPEPEPEPEPEPNPNPNPVEDDDEDLEDITNDDSTDGGDSGSNNSGGGNHTNDQNHSDNQDHDKGTESDQLLPSTATQNFTAFALGALLLIIGLAIVIIVHYKHEKAEA
ncbi:bifunctional metallophosphatase/5'-nucleotidase [Alkalihalobacillus trypoxylicola]|uniref:bifunctional metallophosphatase/5'-nucleotidase n=1 Tax=Alkalihalobacillus trypoxylicola TaxID=519424 RepID=UPI000B1859F8|nr:5'-nucleotidase C-terminal domain-containing protein [Alkalihalobacillus trypoxylicola]